MLRSYQMRGRTDDMWHTFEAMTTGPYKIEPNNFTYQYMLDGCMKKQDTAGVDRVIREMEAHGVRVHKVDARTPLHASMHPSTYGI